MIYTYDVGVEAIKPCLIDPKVQIYCSNGRKVDPNYCFALDTLPKLTQDQLKQITDNPEKNVGGCLRESEVLAEAQNLLNSQPRQPERSNP